MVAVEDTQVKSGLLDKAAAQEHVLSFNYDQDLVDHLLELADKKRLYDAILINVNDCDFLFTVECLLEVARAARHLLAMQGTIIFLRANNAIGLCRDSLTGHLSFLIFDNYAEVFDYSPTLAKHVQMAMGESVNILAENSDLYQQVLMSATPVLTRHGIRLKGTMDQTSRSNTLLAAIDNFTQLATIVQRLGTEQGQMTLAEILEELKVLEAEKAIYPFLAKIPFLVNCFRNKASFSLKDYLLLNGFVTETQLDEMLLEVKQNLSKDHISLGPLALKKGYINGRQLEIMWQDQAFYGQGAQKEKFKVVKNSQEEAQIRSLVGRLGTTDPANLLQNLAQNRDNGVLSVEQKDLQFRAYFEMGQLMRAKMGKIVGNAAVIEFASTWREGIFVFIERTPPADLAKEKCKVTLPLEKLLLDAALAKDKMELFLHKLPKGWDAVLEKVPEQEELLHSGLKHGDQDNNSPNEEEKAVMKRLLNELDGLTPLFSAIRRLGDVTTYDGVMVAEKLLQYKLATIPERDLTVPLARFRRLSDRIAEKLGGERNLAFLRISLRDIMSFSVRARMFSLSAKGGIGIDMAAARSTGASLSLVIKDIEDWQVKYIEYVSQEVKSELLLSIIQEVHQ